MNMGEGINVNYENINKRKGVKFLTLHKIWIDIN